MSAGGKWSGLDGKYWGDRWMSTVLARIKDIEMVIELGPSQSLKHFDTASRTANAGGIGRRKRSRLRHDCSSGRR